MDKRKVFSEYQMEIMSKHVVTQYGFADTQFNDNDDQLRFAYYYYFYISCPWSCLLNHRREDIF